MKGRKRSIIGQGILYIVVIGLFSIFPGPLYAGNSLMKLHGEKLSGLKSLQGVSLERPMPIYEPSAIGILPEGIQGLGMEPPISFEKVNYGEFTDVTYELKEDVVRLNGVLSRDFLEQNVKLREEVEGFSTSMSPISKLSIGALIPKAQLDGFIAPSRGAPGQDISGTVVVDEDNKVALKITGATSVNATDYFEVTKPAIYEVLRDFNIPDQAVYLTQDNLIPASQEVSDSVVPALRGPATDAINEQFPSPLVRLSFENKTFTAYANDGATVKVVLDGVLVIDRIRVDGGYSCFSGYKFQVSTGQGLGFDVEVLAQIEKSVQVPLFALDIPAGIARVYGGIYLNIGINGKFTITVSVGEWTKFGVGLKGSTFLCLPVSFHPIGYFQKGFIGDASFDGEVNGDVTVGPIAGLEIFGFDVVGAGLLVGFGFDASSVLQHDLDLDVDFFKVDADFYIPLRIYFTLIKTFNLVDHHFMLAQFHKVYSAGRDPSGEIRRFRVDFHEACAYRRSVWGDILDMDAPDENGNPSPARNVPFVLSVKRDDQTTTYQGVTDNNGFFAIQDVDLQKGDEVRVTQVSNISLASLPTYPTFPFKKIELDYVDFFDDSSSGQVAPARVVDWDATNARNDGTRVYKWITYTGDVGYEIDGDPDPPVVQSDANGTFYVQHDFKPQRQVTAHIYWNGFHVASEAVEPDVNLGFRVFSYVKSATTHITEDGNTSGRRISEGRFFIYNLNGDKAVAGLPVRVKVDYYLGKRAFHGCLPFHGVYVNPIVGSRSFVVTPVRDRKGENGTSTFNPLFITTWKWPVDTEEAGEEVSLDPVAAGGFNPLEFYFSFKTPLDLLNGQWCEALPQVDTAGCLLLGPLFMVPALSGVSPLVPVVSKMEFDYDGVAVPIRDLDKADYVPECKHVSAGITNPALRVIVDKIWSKINPAPVSAGILTHVEEPFHSGIEAPISTIEPLSPSISTNIGPTVSGVPGIEVPAAVGLGH